jgi:hypothetical protein
MALMRYRFAVVEWYADELRREVQVLTEAGVHKAAWIAGASFSAQHPRSPIRDLVLLKATEPELGADGFVITQSTMSRTPWNCGSQAELSAATCRYRPPELEPAATYVTTAVR